MSDRTRDLKLSVIKQVELQAAKYPDVISLAQGIPDFDTPEYIKRRVQRALADGVVAKYSLSPGLPELREMVELDLAKDGMYYDWENEIIITAGSIEAITATLLATINPGDEVMIPSPTYTSYREAIILAGGIPVYVELDEANDWSFCFERFEQAITPRTKAIFYCNPNNPTGTIYSREQLAGLADLAIKHDLLLISDEVYKDFTYGSEPVFSLAERPELRNRLVRIFSFSKSYAMTGWRVAYLHSDASLVREILKVHDVMVTCAPVISQYAAMGALEIGRRETDRFMVEYSLRRDLICNRLDKLSAFFEYVKPQGAYFVFPKLKNNISSQTFCLDLLDKAQVAVVPGSAFGPSGERHIRLSFGRSSKDINTAFDRIERYIDHLHD